MSPVRNKGQGMAFPFLLGLILFIILWVATGCIIGKLTRESVQGNDAFGIVAKELIDVNQNSKIGETRAIQIHMDKDTSIFISNQNKPMKVALDNFELGHISDFSVLYPDDCPKGSTCICFCKKIDFLDAKKPKGCESEGCTPPNVPLMQICKEHLECQTQDFIITNSYENIGKKVGISMDNGYVISRYDSGLNFITELKTPIMGPKTNQRDRTIYATKSSDNEITLCEYLNSDSSCSKEKSNE